MARYQVHVDKSADVLTLKFTGPHVAKADTKLLTDCWNALLECAEKNDCFEKGFSAACLSTIAQHDRETHCVSRAFGLTSK